MNYFEVFATAILILLGLFIVGIFGFRYFADLPWPAAIEASAGYISGTGSSTEMNTPIAKYWTAFFSLVAAVVIVGVGSSTMGQALSKYLRLNKL